MRVERETAAELLAARVEKAADAAEPEARIPVPRQTRPKKQATPKSPSDPLTDFLHSRQGKTLQREVVRGVFGMLKKRL